MDPKIPQYQPLSRINFGLLLIRIVTAIIFFMHGYQKLFDDGLSVTRDNFDAMGVPLPAITSVLSIVIELVGGFMLFSGVYTRFVALFLGLEMVVAFFFVHVEHGFFVMNGGFELVLLLGTTAFALMIAGGGHYSADDVFHLPYSEDWKSLIESRQSQSSR